MAATHGKDAYWLWNAVSLHPFCTEVALTIDGETVDVQTMGDSWVEKLAGMKSWGVSISGIFEAGASSVDATLGGSVLTSAACEFRANSAAVAVTNPKYTGTAILTSYEVPASIGDAVQFSAEFEGTGALTRATS